MKSARVDLLQTQRGHQADEGGVRFGTDVLILAPAAPAGRSGAAKARQDAHVLRPGVLSAHLHLIIQVGNRFEVEQPDVPILFRKGRYLVVELSPRRRAALPKHHPCYSVRALERGQVVFDAPPPRAARAGRGQRIDELVGRLSVQRMRARLEFLASLPTRLSTTGHFRSAAEWARDQFQDHGCTARLTEIRVASHARSLNVIADRPFTTGSDGPLVLVTAHLDSVNSDGDASSAAPGADDNASGSAGVLEIAAALHDAPLGAHVRYILFGGEEQGLFGSQAYVRSLSAAERGRIRAVVNMDMIGTINGTPEPTRPDRRQPRL